MPYFEDRSVGYLVDISETDPQTFFGMYGLNHNHYRAEADLRLEGGTRDWKLTLGSFFSVAGFAPDTPTDLK